MSRRIVVPAIILYLLMGCAREASQPISPRNGDEYAIELGERAASDLLENLQAALSVGLNNGGTVHAIDLCSRVALAFTKKTADKYPNVKIKRTSFKYRNPYNAPDQLEVKALTHFENKLKSGQPLPPYHLQKIKVGESWIYRYYKPIIVKRSYLKCHGDSRQMSPKVRALLRKRYPKDQAKGYKAGDLRGIVSVEILD